ncbi:secreted protein containing Cytochrome C, Planctomycete domain protein, partial [Rhodopirellula maiorica SM1]
MTCQKKLSLLSIAFVFFCGGSAIDYVALADDQITPQQRRFFEKEVRPLLSEQCYKCHSEKSTKGGLRVDSRSSLLMGGESGSAIEPGDADASVLMEAVRYETFEMPPSKKLSDEQIAILDKWIEMGAPWPGDHGDVVPRPESKSFSDEELNWWAFRPLNGPTPPTQLDHPEWCRNEIDQFIAAELDHQQLVPAPEADRATLLR